MKVLLKWLMETLEKGKEFYLPHMPVIRESAKSAKIIIVYDTFTKPNKHFVSYNK